MKSLSEMTFDEKLSWACGSILIGIGDGKFRGAVAGVIMSVNSEAYDRGKKAGVEIEREAQKEKEPKRWYKQKKRRRLSGRTH